MRVFKNYGLGRSPHVLGQASTMPSQMICTDLFFANCWQPGSLPREPEILLRRVSSLALRGLLTLLMGWYKAALVYFIGIWKQMEINFVWQILQHSLEILPLSGAYRIEICFWCWSMGLLKFPCLRERALLEREVYECHSGSKMRNPVWALLCMDCHSEQIT